MVKSRRTNVPDLLANFFDQKQLDEIDTHCFDVCSSVTEGSIPKTQNLIAIIKHYLKNKELSFSRGS